MKPSHFVFNSSAANDAQQLIEEMQRQFTLLEEEQSSTAALYLDTFDWLLYRKGLLLTRNNTRFVLCTFSGDIVAEGSGSRKKHPFWWDMPEGELRESLRKVIDIRALLPLVEVRTTGRSFRVVNKDKKTTLRLAVEMRQVGTEGEDSPLPAVVSLVPVRGYEKTEKRMHRFLKRAHLEGAASHERSLGPALEAIGRQPLDYTPKFLLTLDGDVAVNEAAREISLSLLVDLQRNLSGVVADIDTEFLHDLRIAVRRTRSLLSLLKKYLSAHEIAYFQAEFKWLGTVTGPVRDLDVYLLGQEDYAAMVPLSLQPGLTLFFEDLARRRKKEVSLLIKNLSSDRFYALLDQWSQFLQSTVLESEQGPGARNCRKVVVKIIHKRFQRILRDGRRITYLSPDSTLHELRIQGKKFRYLLEFFRSFFVDAEVELFVKQLKKLQNNLGDFNDLSVQQEMLTEYQQTLVGRNRKTIALAGSLGGLITHLADQQKGVKKKFEKTFKHFSCDDNITLFEETFAKL